MARSHVKYNGSACAQDNISCDTFVCGAHGSVCAKNNIFMTHLHVEHVGSACLQDRTSLLERPLVPHNVCQLN